MVASEPPLVTVGLPVYNGEPYLQEAVESILGQTFPNLELVIADNASTDRTQEICERFVAADHRVRYFRHATNLGAAPNYNFTVDNALGEYFMWSAHDDVRAPTFLEEALGVFRSEPGTAVVFSRAERIDKNGEKRGDLPRPKELTSSDPSERLRAAITCRHPALVVFGLMPLSVLNSTGRHGAYPGADRVLAVELALRGPLAELPGVLFFSRDHPDRYVRLGRKAGRAAQNAWWDAARTGRSDVPALRRLMAYRRAIKTSGLPAAERNRCRAAFRQAALSNRAAILRELAGDLVRAAFQSARDRLPTGK